MWRFDLDYSKNLPQRTCISRPLPTLRTNSLKFRLVRINHKGRVFQDGTPVYHYKLKMVKRPMLFYPSPPPPPPPPYTRHNIDTNIYKKLTYYFISIRIPNILSIRFLHLPFDLTNDFDARYYFIIRILSVAL